MKCSTVENNKTCSLCKLFVYLKRKIVSGLTKLVTVPRDLCIGPCCVRLNACLIVILKFRQFNSASRSVINHNNSLCILNKEVLFENNTLNTFIDKYKWVFLLKVLY